MISGIIDSPTTTLVVATMLLVAIVAAFGYVFGLMWTTATGRSLDCWTVTRGVSLFTLGVCVVLIITIAAG